MRSTQLIRYSRCTSLQDTPCTARPCRCLLSSSCQQRKAHSRSTSCSPQGSTLQQGKRCMRQWCRCPQQKSCPPRTRRCRWSCCSFQDSIYHLDMHCRTSSRRCLELRIFQSRTIRSRPTSCSQQGSTLQQGTTNTTPLTWTRCSRCTFQPNTNYTTQWCRCPQTRSCRPRKAHSRPTSCSQQGSTPQRDTPCTAR